MVRAKYNARASNCETHSKCSDGDTSFLSVDCGSADLLESMNYAIITPARNEEKYISYTLDSVVRQTLLPSIWVIVDDKSEDNTTQIVAEYQKTHNWIRLVINTKPSEPRGGGIKVVQLFNLGLSRLEMNQYDFVVKLDADLSLPSEYFEKISQHFSGHDDTGICGGYCVIQKDGRFIKEKAASYHVRGAIKAYRRNCFQKIGGLPLYYNWDGLDEMKAMSMGWKVSVLPLEVLHHRPTGKETNAGIRSSFRAGREYYLDGNDLMIAVLRAASMSVRTEPRLLSGIAFLAGFTVGSLGNERKHVDQNLQRYIRAFQYARIRHFVEKKLKSVSLH